jgi:hypothetical protein
MEQIILNLIKTRNLQVKLTPKSNYPLIFMDGKNICETELRKHGFSDINNFLSWVKSTENKYQINIIQKRN